MSARKILVADDSKTVRTQVRQILGRCGYDVMLARDGREALQQAAAEPPDLLVVDINMPLLDGFELCLELRKKGLPWSGIPVIFLTSSRSSALSVLGAEMGAYLRKPLHPERFLEAVQSFVAPAENRPDTLSNDVPSPVPGFSGS